MLEALGWAALAILVAGGLCALAVVFLPAGEQIAPPVRDEPLWMLPPDRDLHSEDVDTVRLPVALRGYRFAETDLLLDRLAAELRSRDLEITRLRGMREDAPLGDSTGVMTEPPDAPVVVDPEPDDRSPFAPPEPAVLSPTGAVEDDDGDERA